MVVVSWCHSAQRTTKCVQEQVPHQVKKILSGDFEAAVAIVKVPMMDPVLEQTIILLETFAEVVAGKKELTNKVVKHASPIESMSKINEETKVEGSSNLSNEFINPPTSMCVVDNSSP